MINVRRTILLPSVFLAVAASAQTSADVHLPEPYEPCLPISDCPREPKPPVEDCRRKPREPRPYRALEGTREKVGSAVSQLGNGDTVSAAASLDVLFSGSASKNDSKDSGGSAVYIGAWAPSSRIPLIARPAQRGPVVRNEGVSGPVFRKVGCADDKGCKSETGKVVEDAVSGLGKLVDKLIGDPLRDSGDAALKKGNEDKKRAEEEWKKK